MLTKTKFCQKFLRFFSLSLLALLVAACSSTTTIYHSLDEGDANDIIVYLDNKGIKAYKVQSVTGGGPQDQVLWDITVANEEEKQAMALLRAAGLPRRQGQSLLTIFEKGALVPSELEEKIRYEAGLGEQVASTIRKIDGVLDAEVLLSFPETDPLNPDRTTGDVTASVYVKHTGVLDDPNTQLVPKIRRLVASAIQGLKFDNVTVITDKARYADISLREQRARIEADKDWVRVWSVIVAKESSRRFQVLFFVFLVLILILLVALGWIIWKMHRLIPKGGVGQYFSFSPFTSEKTALEHKKKRRNEGDEDDDDEEEDDDDEEDEEDEDDEEDEERVKKRKPVETEAPPETLDEDES